ncbi:uncharacterized protein LOC119832619 [Zerene cesonia]|uniref:uncharacterized protein LOC119832619 n=1 Tax=Zerene cesonia TaxID=33412 RepID=UPI0018E543DD|nr:uncharacterized protein LOC119832619 [Zerene cesonia]XP_038212230.1 uncharacterized protein LOC119832619 [Zerene cesonia]
MSFGKWYTIEDVTQDIARASGQLVSDLNAKYVVVGKQKPRYNTDKDEFEDMQNLKGQYIIRDENKPDLQGISELIRLVDGYSTNESSLDESNNNKTRETFTQEAVVISKLNPYVPAFVPKSSAQLLPNVYSNMDKTAESSVSGHMKQIKQDKINPTDQLKENTKNFNTTRVSTRSNDNDQNYTHLCDLKKIEMIPVDNRIDISSLEPNEKEKLKENLRTSISNTAQTSCVKVKRQRNLAIATLMKLFSDTPPSRQDEVSEVKPHLISPQYFECSVCDNERLNKTDKKQLETSIEQLSLNKSSEAEETQTYYVENSIDKVNQWLKRPDYSPVSECDNIDKTGNKMSNIRTASSEEYENNERLCSNVKKPIEKVNTWLKDPEEQVKSSQLFLGPITFKRKATRKSPDTQTGASSSVGSEPLVVEPIKNYVPSAYATELSEKYMKRVKDKTASTQDIWTKLEEDLKSKDEIVRRRISSPDS